MKILVMNYNGEKINVLVEIRNKRILKKLQDLTTKANKAVLIAAYSHGHFCRSLESVKGQSNIADLVVDYSASS